MFPDLLKASWCLVLPSFSEGLPKVLQEASAAGRPAISSKVGGICQIVADGVSGLLFDPNKVQELAEKLEFVFSNEEVAIRFGMKGREIAEKFSASKALENWGRILSEVSKSTK
jgi:glycosyltransferase involved in cell wall biosynthesis